MLVELLDAQRQTGQDGDVVAIEVVTRSGGQDRRWSVPIDTEQGQRMVRITSDWTGLFGNDPDARRGFATLIYRVIHDEPLRLPTTVRVDDSLWNSGQVAATAA